MPYGEPDPATLEHGVDVAILCAASFEQVADYPDHLLKRLQPHEVFLGRWEDFFISPDVEERTLRLTNVSRFIERVKRVVPDAGITLPRRHTVIDVIPPR